MRRFLLFILCFQVSAAIAQSVNIHPTITPTLFQHNTTITVTYDVTGTPLATLPEAWAWVWIPDATAIDAKYNHNPATAADAPAKFTKTVNGGTTTFSLAFKPSDFFVQDISTRTSMGILLKAADWSGGQTVDHVATFGFSLTLNQPSVRPVFVDNGEQLTIQATTPVASTFELFINNVSVHTQSGITNYTRNHTVTESSGAVPVRLTATSASGNDEVTFQYIISANSSVQARPPGIISGINYKAADNTKVTLCVLAPGKTSVYVRGDFSDWDILPANLMKRDGEYFWIELSGLTSGTEYAFQYLVDETIWIADPYADKILDPDDQYISDATYPNLKDFPTEALGSQWYWNRLSVFQTGQTAYNWQVTNFDKPDKDKLVVYELLVRDYFEDPDNNYQTLIDTISYLKNLGVNAIELMPIMEFGGNNSWGYNPQFMFAPDKAYGTKNKLKEFIDVCHQNGIAVILDITLNHQDMPNPYLMMDFNFATSKPNPTNKFFNVDAKHPFNVFFDMNHESSYTKKYLDTINYYWLHEYKVDGYRFDLSKGFTQVNNPNNVSAWSAYDASRIALLKRMSDRIWATFPDAYVILEHLSVNTEEKELAEYRAGEGKGMMLWGNLNHAYLQSSMGFASESDFSGVYYGNRGWTVPHLVSYMESHDEERMIYKNVTFGNAAGTYSVKDLNTALNRARAASTIFYTIPGPKMLWQFGELGYDYSINYCQDDGTISDACRTYPKPVKWDYRQSNSRNVLYSHVADLIRLRNTYDVFTSGTPTFSVGSGSLEKQVMLKNIPYTPTPSNAGEMNAVVVVNFDVTAKTTTVNFPHAGTWYDYYGEGAELNVPSAAFGISLQPGEFKIFTDVQIEDPEVITGVGPEVSISVSAYPNPAGNTLMIASDESIVSLSMITTQGVRLTPKRTTAESWDISDLAPGLYIAEVKTRTGSVKIKVIKQND
jgi:1,4-alpha-glucan branching enzyme